MTHLRPFDFRQNIVEQVRAWATVSTCLLSTSACLAGLYFARDYQMKLYASIGALGCGVAGLVSGKTLEERSRVLADWEDISDQQRTNYISQQLAPTQLAQVGQLGQTHNLTPFDWQRLRAQPDKFPHLMLLGGTGHGKSVLAENLAAILGGRVIGVIPHWQAGDFGTLDCLVGEELNYGESALPYADEPERGKSQNTDPELSLDLILNKKVRPTICQFLRALYQEMKARYQLDEVTRTRQVGEPLTIILDEYLSYAKLPGVDKVVKPLVREARKVGIRLCFLVQGDNVAGLGWEGEGDLRENLTYIYMNSFATARVKVIRNAQKDEFDKTYWQSVLSQLERDEYATLVEDEYAVRPTPGQFVSPTKHILESQASTQVNRVTPTSYQLVNLPESSPEVTEPRLTPGTTENQGLQPTDAPKFPSYQEDNKVLFDLYEAAVFHGNLGYSRSRIIKEVWGKKGKYYKQGCLYWQLVEEEFGAIPLSKNLEECEDSD